MGDGEARKRPGYAEAYDALEEEFSLVTALIKARTNSGLTQAELAKRMSTTQAVIARLEAGGRRLHVPGVGSACSGPCGRAR